MRLCPQLPDSWRLPGCIGAGRQCPRSGRRTATGAHNSYLHGARGLRVDVYAHTGAAGARGVSCHVAGIARHVGRACVGHELQCLPSTRVCTALCQGGKGCGAMQSGATAMAAGMWLPVQVSTRTPTCCHVCTHTYTHTRIRSHLHGPCSAEVRVHLSSGACARSTTHRCSCCTIGSDHLSGRQAGHSGGVLLRCVWWYASSRLLAQATDSPAGAPPTWRANVRKVWAWGCLLLSGEPSSR